MMGFMREAGIRDRILFNAEGSPVSSDFAEKACCDVYAPTAFDVFSRRP